MSSIKPSLIARNDSPSLLSTNNVPDFEISPPSLEFVLDRSKIPSLFQKTNHYTQQIPEILLPDMIQPISILDNRIQMSHKISQLSVFWLECLSTMESNIFANLLSQAITFHYSSRRVIGWSQVSYNTNYIQPSTYDPQGKTVKFVDFSKFSNWLKISDSEKPNLQLEKTWLDFVLLSLIFQRPQFLPFCLLPLCRLLRENLLIFNPNLPPFYAFNLALSNANDLFHWIPFSQRKATFFSILTTLHSMNTVKQSSPTYSPISEWISFLLSRIDTLLLIRFIPHCLNWALISTQELGHLGRFQCLEYALLECSKTKSVEISLPMVITVTSYLYYSLVMHAFQQKSSSTPSTSKSLSILLNQLFSLWSPLYSQFLSTSSLEHSLRFSLYLASLPSFPLIQEIPSSSISVDPSQKKSNTTEALSKTKRNPDSQFSSPAASRRRTSASQSASSEPLPIEKPFSFVTHFFNNILSLDQVAFYLNAFLPFFKMNPLIKPKHSHFICHMFKLNVHNRDLSTSHNIATYKKLLKDVWSFSNIPPLSFQKLRNDFFSTPSMKLLPLLNLPSPSTLNINDWKEKFLNPHIVQSILEYDFSSSIQFATVLNTYSVCTFLSYYSGSPEIAQVFFENWIQDTDILKEELIQGISAMPERILHISQQKSSVQKIEKSSNKSSQNGSDDPLEENSSNNHKNSKKQTSLYKQIGEKLLIWACRATRVYQPFFQVLSCYEQFIPYCETLLVKFINTLSEYLSLLSKIENIDELSQVYAICYDWTEKSLNSLILWLTLSGYPFSKRLLSIIVYQSVFPGPSSVLSIPLTNMLIKIFRYIFTSVCLAPSFLRQSPVENISDFVFGELKDSSLSKRPYVTQIIILSHALSSGRSSNAIFGLLISWAKDFLKSPSVSIPDSSMSSQLKTGNADNHSNDPIDTHLAAIAQWILSLLLVSIPVNSLTTSMFTHSLSHAFELIQRPAKNSFQFVQCVLILWKTMFQSEFLKLFRNPSSESIITISLLLPDVQQCSHHLNYYFNEKIVYQIKSTKSQLIKENRIIEYYHLYLVESIKQQISKYSSSQSSLLKQDHLNQLEHILLPSVRSSFTCNSCKFGFYSNPKLLGQHFDLSNSDTGTFQSQNNSFYTFSDSSLFNNLNASTSSSSKRNNLFGQLLINWSWSGIYCSSLRIEKLLHWTFSSQVIFSILQRVIFYSYSVKQDSKASIPLLKQCIHHLLNDFDQMIHLLLFFFDYEQSILHIGKESSQYQFLPIMFANSIQREDSLLDDSADDEIKVNLSSLSSLTNPYFQFSSCHTIYQLFYFLMYSFSKTPNPEETQQSFHIHSQIYNFFNSLIFRIEERVRHSFVCRTKLFQPQFVLPKIIKYRLSPEFIQCCIEQKSIQKMIRASPEYHQDMIWRIEFTFGIQNNSKLPAFLSKNSFHPLIHSCIADALHKNLSSEAAAYVLSFKSAFLYTFLVDCLFGIENIFAAINPKSLDSVIDGTFTPSRVIQPPSLYEYPWNSLIEKTKDICKTLFDETQEN